MTQYVAMNELEGCILGVIWRDGPISAYGVRADFARSRTAEWSSSTGTVYPAIRRLREAGHVDATSPQGPRNTELLTVTAAGLDLLQRWLGAVDDWGGANADPLRTRLHFLLALPKAQRRRTLLRYKEVTRQALDRAREDEERSRKAKDRTRAEYIGNVGCRYQLEARLAWLEWVGKGLD